MSSIPQYLMVARILSPWGTRGEVKVEIATNFPERLAPGKQVYLDGQAVLIESSRPHKGNLVLKLSGIDTIQSAEKLRGHDLTIPSSELGPLPPGSYYHFQIIGLEVKTTKGQVIGKISDIFSTASNDVYVVQGDKREILIPAIEDVVKSIDVEKGEVVIEPIEGLL